jgi:hypothetical protein
VNTTAITLVLIGFILLYGAIKNKNPLEVVKNAIGGKPVAQSKSLQPS